MIVKWNHRVEDKLLYRRGVRRLFAYSRASSLSRAAVRMADISLTEALGVQFYCYRCSLLPSDSALEVGSSLDLFACVCTRKFWVFKIFGMVQIFVDLIFERQSVIEN